jgi:DNA-binding NarL/FixJ family response regulator
MRSAVPITSTDPERAKLTRWARSRRAPARLVTRAKIMLLAAGGQQNYEIAERLRINRDTVSRWPRRFAA